MRIGVENPFPFSLSLSFLVSFPEPAAWGITHLWFLLFFLHRKQSCLISPPDCTLRGVPFPPFAGSFVKFSRAGLAGR